MDYEVLRKFQRIERNTANLAEISGTFYSELASLIKEQAQKYEKSHSIEDAKTLDNIRKIALDIFEKREQKLMLKALRCIRNNESECNAIELEKTLLDNVQEVLKANREEFDKIIIGEGFAETPDIFKMTFQIIFHVNLIRAPIIPCDIMPGVE